MPSSPLISVITPSYMQGKFIDACIGSVKRQSYDNIEHLIFDAQSSDTTDSVVKSHLGTYNLQYFSEPDTGQANALNKGLDRAKGDIVCWLNSDDLFHKRTRIGQDRRPFSETPSNRCHHRRGRLHHSGGKMDPGHSSREESGFAPVYETGLSHPSTLDFLAKNRFAAG